MSVTGFHHVLALIVGAGLAVDGVDLAIGAGLAGALLNERFTDLEDAGWLASATALGLAIGGLATGFLADRFGRLMVMRFTILFIAAAGVCAALSPTLAILIFFRFLTALALGGETVLAYGMLTEFMPKRTRGRWMTWTALIASLGLPLSLALATFVLPLPHGWRWHLVAPACAAPGIFGLRLLLMESPRWLAARGRVEEAERIVARIEAGAKGAMPEPDPVVREQGPIASEHGLARRFLLATLINIAGIAGVFGFVNWLPAFCVAEGESIARSSLFSALMTAGAPVGTMLAFVITDRFERRWAVVACALAAAFIGALYAQVRLDIALAALGFITVVALYSSATLAMINYAPELFATQTRLRAIGTASAVGRAFAVALPVLVVPLFDAFGQSGPVALVVLLHVLQALAVALLGVDTRGRALESI